MPLHLVPPAKPKIIRDPHQDIFDAIEEVEAAITEGRDIDARLWLRVVKKLSHEAKTLLALTGYGRKP